MDVKKQDRNFCFWAGSIMFFIFCFQTFFQHGIKLHAILATSLLTCSCSLSIKYNSSRSAIPSHNNTVYCRGYKIFPLVKNTTNVNEELVSVKSYFPNLFENYSIFFVNQNCANFKTSIPFILLNNNYI